jgi:hypothetical protein
MRYAKGSQGHGRRAWSEACSVGLLDKLRRLECSAANSLQSFLLKDGTRHYYDPMSGELFLHSVACLRAQGDGETSFPEPPETIKALTSRE